MDYSRRNFLKAAGSSAAAITTVATGADALSAAQAPARTPAAAPALAIPAGMTQEKATLNINDKPYPTSYEARTTLWEVIHVKLGLTGTNRSCNRGSCGACSVLLDGVPVYSCHTLATEAVGKKIFTVEGLGTEKNLHPLQAVGYRYMAADCGYCTAGWEVTAKALLDKNNNPSETEVKAALAGHICRCAAYPSIIRTVIDTGKLMRGEAELG